MIPSIFFVGFENELKYASNLSLAKNTKLMQDNFFSVNN